MTHHQAIELLPCPFCGGKSIQPHLDHCMICVNCGAEGELCDTPERAIAAWNRRAAPASEPAVDRDSGSRLFAWLSRAAICGIPAIQSAAKVMQDYYEGVGPEPEYDAQATPAAPEVPQPDDFNVLKVMPLHATEAMRDAWDSAGFHEDGNVEFQRAYAAMLAAAPGVPAPAASDEPIFNIVPNLTKQDEADAAKGICPSCKYLGLHEITSTADGFRFMGCRKCKDITVLRATTSKSIEGGEA